MSFTLGPRDPRKNLVHMPRTRLGSIHSCQFQVQAMQQQGHTAVRFLQSTQQKNLRVNWAAPLFNPFLTLSPSRSLKPLSSIHPSSIRVHAVNMAQVLCVTCRYCPDKNAATSVNGTSGCSIYFLGRLYDGVSSKRRGVTSLSLPKPKLHLTLNQPVSLNPKP